MTSSSHILPFQKPPKLNLAILPHWTPEESTLTERIITQTNCICGLFFSSTGTDASDLLFRCSVAVLATWKHSPFCRIQVYFSPKAQYILCWVLHKSVNYLNCWQEYKYLDWPGAGCSFEYLLRLLKCLSHFSLRGELLPLMRSVCWLWHQTETLSLNRGCSHFLRVQMKNFKNVISQLSEWLPWNSDPITSC